MKSIYKSKRQKKAFTLIELLIVIAIIGILFVVLVSRVDFATDKAKTTGVQTDFRAFQVAFEQVSKEKAGFATFGWDIGDANGNRIRDSYDTGDANQNGKEDDGEIFVGRKEYGETWTGIYTLKNPKPGMEQDYSAVSALEAAINANLDPKLHITISNPDANGRYLITMANQARDPWGKEYHGEYLTNAAVDNMDRGAIILYSDGANGKNGSEHHIANGVVTVTVPGNNVAGQDDYAIISCYTYANGYGETKTATSGFINNHSFLGSVNDINNTIPKIADKPIYNKLYSAQIPIDESGATIDLSLMFTEHDAILTLSAQGQVAGSETSPYEVMSWDNMITTIGANEEDVSQLQAIGFLEEANYIVVGGNLPCMLGFDAQSIIFVLPGSELIPIPMRLDGSHDDNTIIDGDYVYVYDPNSDAYTAMVTDKNKSSYEIVKSSLNNKRVILNNTYANCTNVLHIDIPNNVELGKRIFDNSSVESVTIAEGIEKIGTYAFAYASNLKTVNLPTSLTTIETRAFYDSGLIEINIPTGVTVITKEAFEGCTKLQTVRLPHGLTTIEQEAFFQCNAIVDLYWPSTIKNVGPGAFGKYEGRTRTKINVYVDGTVLDWANISFDSGVVGANPCYYTATLYFENIASANLIIPEGATTLSYTAFMNCTQYTSVTIPSSVTKIDGAVFMGCTNITTIIFQGTTAQWNAITKGPNWYNGVPVTEVVCLDGTVAL